MNLYNDIPEQMQTVNDYWWHWFFWSYGIEPFFDD